MKVVIGNLLLFIVNTYTLLLFLRVLFSWIILPPNKFTYFLNEVTNPVISFFKKVCPIRIGILDLSILVPFFILSIINKLIVDLIIFDGAQRPVFYLVRVLFFLIQGAVSVICSVAFVLVLIYMLLMIFAKRQYSPLLFSIRSAVDPVIIKMQNVLHLHSPKADIICLIIIMVCILLISAAVNIVLGLILQGLSGIITV